MTIKRLFFGAQVSAAWPPHLPSGRLLDPTQRHCTLAFLGNVPWEPLQAQLPNLPRPQFTHAPQGHFDQLLLLPPRHPRVVAWHITFADDALATYQQQLAAALRALNYPIDERPFLAHVTLARAPFTASDWEAAFKPMPCQVTAIHLYESLGNLRYAPLWSHPLLTKFKVKTI